MVYVFAVEILRYDVVCRVQFLRREDFEKIGIWSLLFGKFLLDSHLEPRETYTAPQRPVVHVIRERIFF